MTFSEIKELDQAYVAHTYGRANLAVKCGKGAACEDFDGKRYIDFSSGIGVNSLGFADPEWVKAVSSKPPVWRTSQTSTIPHPARWSPGSCAKNRA